MEKRDKQGQVLLSLSDEIIRIRGKQDMVDIIHHKLKKYIQFDDSFILRYSKEKRTGSPYIYYSEQARSENPDYKTYLGLEYHVADDTVEDINYPQVYEVDTLLPFGTEQIKFMHNSGIKEFAVIKLIEGNQLKGLFILLSGKTNSFKPEDLDLLHRISYQLSTATANIIANEEIAKREEEKSILLSLTSEIAAVRNKNELSELLNAKLKNLFPIKGFGITLINTDGKTHSPFVVDVNEELKRGNDFKEAISLIYNVTDGVFNVFINADDPVTLEVAELAQMAEAPAYVDFWKKMDVKQVVGIPVRVGVNNLGCFILLHDHYSSEKINSNLFKGVCSQVSVAISNITANEEIAKSEEEKTILLSLSNEISSLKDRNELFQTVKERIKKIFSITEFGIAKIDEDGKTYSAFMMDLEAYITSDVDFKAATSAHYNVTDPLFNRVINSQEPVIFQVNEIVDVSGMPAFVHFWKKVGVQQVLCAALKAGGKNIGMAVLHFDTNNPINPTGFLLKGVCAHLSVAISNILANEEIKEREYEKTILLSLSNEIASLKDRNDLSRIVNTRIKKLFSIKQFGIAQINEDKVTHSAFMMDLGDPVHNHNHFSEVTTLKYSITDTAFSSIMASDDPVILDVLRLAAEPDPPEYVHFWKAVGFKKLLCLALRVGGNNIGCIFFNIEANNVNNIKNNLLKSVCAQLSVAVSNIMANDEIRGRAMEKSRLLSFSNSMASSRDKSIMGKILTRQLKEVLGIKGYFMVYALSNDKKTYYPILFDPGASLSNLTKDPGFEKMVRSDNLVSESIVKKILEMDDPIVFGVEERFNKPITPAYKKMMDDRGITKITGAPIKLGNEAIGVILFDTNNAPLGMQEQLFKGICSQIAIAVSNIIADDEIQGREEEKSMLLDFSNLIASARDNASLAKILNRELKRLLGIKEYAIHILSEDKKTHRPVLYDPEAEFAKHPIFLKLVNKQTDVNDGIFNIILASDEPITFDAKQWVTLTEPPVYAHAAIDIGLKKLTGVRIHLGEENIAVLNFRHDDVNMTANQYPLLKSICSQIAIAIANIMANEKVLNQLVEIDKYKEQLEQEKVYLKEEIETTQHFSELIGESVEMNKVFRLVEQVSTSDSTVLILGETGTGKELIARAVHNGSGRKSKLMIKVNCAAIPPNLIESELFGHERGSFTGATERRIGKFELAHQGTLFLDEIGEMPLELQVKLLRALQEKEIERVGGKTTIKVDVRIIAATNRDLEKLMEDGKFRSDLFYRLNIFPINLPPLRNRSEDIPALAFHFLKRFSKKAGKQVKTFSNKAIQELIQYNWPGNIRELEHLIERSVLLTNTDAIKEILLPVQTKNPTSVKVQDDIPTKTIDENEREYILKVLRHVKGKISGDGGAADLLGVPPSTLNSRIKRLGIRREHFG